MRQPSSPFAFIADIDPALQGKMLLNEMLRLGYVEAVMQSIPAALKAGTTEAQGFLLGVRSVLEGRSA